MIRHQPFRAICCRSCCAALAAALCLFATPLAAQVERLPPIGYAQRPSPGAAYYADRTELTSATAGLSSSARNTAGQASSGTLGVNPSQPSYPGLLMSYPDSTAETVQAPGESEVETPSDLPFDARSGMFQKLIFTGAWLARTGRDGFGMSDLELSSVLAFPIPSRSFPLIVTPGFGVHYLDGPESRDLPPRVYDAYAQFRWMRRLSPSWGIDLAITPGVFSDFEQSSDKAFRITGHAATAWTASPTLDFVLGAAYIDRQTTKVLPIAGIVWKPNNDVKFDLVFPHPRIARRIYHAGACTDDVQDWVYVSGELGGGTWAVRRSGGESDMVDYTDYRLILGAEHKSLGRLDYLIEAGYVFGRKIRFASDTPRLDPNDTVMVRGGVTY